MEDVETVLAQQKTYFNSGKTRNVSFRRLQLEILRHAIEQYEDRILEALRGDLGKSAYEGYLTEVGIVLEEIRHTRRHLARWARPRRVRTPYYHFPAVSKIHPEPYGSVLVISPWNYPFQLAIAPMAGAISAGNCAVIKPSEFAPRTAEVIADMIAGYFDPGFVTVVTGDVEASKALLDQPFDYIFFTGSTEVGRQVMSAAARRPTPVTLELGGKSPTIVTADADIDSAARKIASGKFINAGQTCIAPDYVVAHRSVKDALVDRIGAHVEIFFGENPRESTDYPRIVNSRHFDRLSGLMEGAEIAWGGRTDRDSLYIAPTLADNVSWDHPLMRDEIFGPILPVLTYDRLTEVIEQIRSRPKPLALYLFARNGGDEKRVVNELSYGGGCINDTLIHLATPYLPFGGVGASGMGRYHGKASFDTFSHEKSILKNLSPIDNPFRFPPYMKTLRLVKKFIG